MCGIAGFTIPIGLDFDQRQRQYGDRLRTMTASLYHRGPDAQRAILCDGVALGHTRLSIVDVASGHQPMSDPDTGLTIVFNGEVFNYVELRTNLENSYTFRTRSDTEVILAAFRDRGIDCVRDFIGQFAFVIFDPRDQSLWFARDRVGIRPLYYTQSDEGLAFASEAKALFASSTVTPEIDNRAVAETLSLWAPLEGHSMFRNVSALPPGHTACFRAGHFSMQKYWDVDLEDDRVDRQMTLAGGLEELGSILNDAVRLRLRADVPVAAYLSGGLDSSLLCALAQRQLGGTLQSFSVGFEQARYDEQAYQRQVALALETQHHVVEVRDRSLGALLPSVVWHSEQLLLRSAPAPFLALSRLVRDHDTKVVLTGEGADEIFWGYDLYKETAIRAFWARQPKSPHRPKLFKRIYPYLPLSQQSPEVLADFFGLGLSDPNAFDFSHQIRWSNSGRIARFLSIDLLSELKDYNPAIALRDSLPKRVFSMRPLARAQYLEMKTLLSGYLLSAQGDRMLMGNSVEGRFPFLDHRVIEFAARVPDSLKLKVLNEKYILKRYAEGKVPDAVLNRPKFPYRAPIAEALVKSTAPEWSRNLLTKDAVNSTHIFDGQRVEKLVNKLSRSAHPPSEADNMALIAVASCQLLHHAFVQAPEKPSPQHIDAVLLQEGP